MPEPLQAAFIGAIGALVALIVNTMLSIWRENRAADRSRRERLYADRQRAVAGLLAEGDKIERLARDRIARSECGGAMMPAEENESERYEHWPALRDALSLVTLLCSITCRVTAYTFVQMVEEYAWTGGRLERLEDARRGFIKAAQWELEVEPNPVRKPRGL